jgi:hypothetical protein
VRKTYDLLVLSDGDHAVRTDTHTSPQQQQKIKQQKKIFQTLCYDLSFHLCVAYLRTSQTADAAGEITSAMRDSSTNDVDDKVRRKKGWTLAALAYAASRRNEEVENALTQLRGLYEGPVEGKHMLLKG